jgi:DHA1 family tetracycline resistance protein-like MFS transporter
MTKNRQLLLILCIALLDVTAANGLGALISDYVVDLPAKALMLTGGVAVMLSIQLAFSPAIGNWSDKKGRRRVILATTLASFLSTLLLLQVQAGTYVANRVAKGGTNGLYAVLRSSITDLTDKQELVRWSGILSFIVGSGPVVGPMVAGLFLLSTSAVRFDPVPTVLFLLAVGLLNIGLALTFRETNPKREELDPDQIKEKMLSSIKVVTLWQQLNESEEKVPGIKPVFILNMLGTLGIGYYTFFVAFLTQSQLLMSTRQTAVFFVYFGALALLANVVFFRFLAHRVHKRKVIIGLALLGIVLQVLYAFIGPSETMLYVVGGIDALTVSVLSGLIGSILSQITKAGGGQGEVFGNIQALGGLASFSTALVNSLLSSVSPQAPFVFCALSLMAVVFWSLRLPDTARQYTDA